MLKKKKENVLPTKAAFDILSAFIQLQKGLLVQMCGSVLAPMGQRAMAGQHTGPITRVKAVPSPVTSVHCSIHRERGWLQTTCLPI